MPRPKTIAKWIEMSQGFIHSRPPKQRDWEATLFINSVEVREHANGRKYLLRTAGCEFLDADSEQEMKDRVGAFMLREDVRLLAAGLEANDTDALPRRVEDPPEEILNGTDDIYHVEPEPAGNA
jgi:hypothetical protein